tara:strand:- start:229 stop:375 length:147 start_codon:yes stop_codon:yes gene_type:complete
MTFEHGLLMFFLGTGITLVGFFVAYLIANNYYQRKEAEKTRKKHPWEN